LGRDVYLSLVKFLNSSTVREVWLNIFLYISISFLSTLELVKDHLNEWNTSILWYIDWRVLLFFIVVIFLDGFLPLSRLIIPNPHGMFKLEKRNMIFQGGGSLNNIRSLILKEKIVDKVFEVFVLFLLISNIIIILFMFLCFTGR
jgi:hypothetical protein